MVFFWQLNLIRFFIITLSDWHFVIQSEVTSLTWLAHIRAQKTHTRLSALRVRNIHVLPVFLLIHWFLPPWFWFYDTQLKIDLKERLYYMKQNSQQKRRTYIQTAHHSKDGKDQTQPKEEMSPATSVNWSALEFTSLYKSRQVKHFRLSGAELPFENISSLRSFVLLLPSASDICTTNFKFNVFFFLRYKIKLVINTNMHTKHIELQKMEASY